MCNYTQTPTVLLRGLGKKTQIQTNDPDVQELTVLLFTPSAKCADVGQYGHAGAYFV